MTWPYREFAEYVETSMRAAGIRSRAELARRTGMGESILSKWWAGKHQPGRDSLRSLATVLGVPLRVLELKSGLVDPSEITTAPDSRVLPRAIERLISTYLAAAKNRPDLLDGLLERIDDVTDWYHVKVERRRH